MSDKRVAAVLEKARTLRELPTPKRRRAIRLRAGLVQQDVADALGVTREAVAKWETGDRAPRGELLQAYVALLQQLQAGQKRSRS